MTQNAIHRPLTAAAASEVQSGPHEAETVCSVQNLRRPRLLIQTLFCLDRFGTRRVSGRRPDRGAVRRQGAVAAARGVVDRRRVETILAQGRVSQGRVPGQMAPHRRIMGLNCCQAGILDLRPKKAPSKIIPVINKN